jgi:tRNA(Ile)-lysidine synthase
MIELYRKEIEQYLKSKKITARIDRSNYETKYLRNRVRHNLIPALESYNPKIRESLVRAIDAANTIQDFIESKAKVAFKKAVSLKTNDQIKLDIKELNKTDPMLKGEVLRLAIGAVKKDLVDISLIHINDIIGQLGKKRGEVDLPGIYVLVNKGMLSISGQRPQKSKPVQFMRKLEIPGEIRDESGEMIIEADLMDSVPTSELHAKNPYQAFLDYDKIVKPLIVRNRREGDAYSPLGLKGRKKLQDIFVDEKVDIDERDRIPVVEDATRRIVWVVGYRMAEEAKVTPKTKKVVKLSAKSINR